MALQWPRGIVDTPQVPVDRVELNATTVTLTLPAPDGE